MKFKIIVSGILALILLNGCTEKETNLINDEVKFYQEIETNLVDGDGITLTAMEKEIERLKQKGVSFWHDDKLEINSREELKFASPEPQCGITRESCKLEAPWGENANKMTLIDKSYSYGEDFYVIGTFDENCTQDITKYVILKNDQEIFASDMYFGTSGPITEAVNVLNSPAFTFLKIEGGGPASEDNVKSNIWYEGETLNEKYGVEGSSYLFGFNDKTGFVAEKNGARFVFYNGQKISEDFDTIRTISCCASIAYPIKLDENGILFLTAKRGEEIFFVEINLNEFLSK